MSTPFKAKKLDLTSINNGNQFQPGDGVTPNAINDPIEAAAYIQALATNAPDVSEIRGDGEPQVIIQELGDGTPQFKFVNIARYLMRYRHVVYIKNPYLAANGSYKWTWIHFSFVHPTMLTQASGVVQTNMANLANMLVVAGYSPSQRIVVHQSVPEAAYPDNYVYTLYPNSSGSAVNVDAAVKGGLLGGGTVYISRTEVVLGTV